MQSLIADGERQWAEGSYDDAISSFTNALKLDPNNPKAASGLRKAQKAKADEEKALLEPR